jgi:hypothetical protein
MPHTYTITGYDSSGTRHTYAMDASGTVTSPEGGDDLLPSFLADNPLEPPPEGTPAPDPDAPLPPERLDAMRQHASKVLTYVVVHQDPQPGEAEALTDPPRTQALTDPPTAQPAGSTRSPEPEPDPSASQPSQTPYVPPGA